MNIPIAPSARRASGALPFARDVGPTLARSCCCSTTPIGFDEKPGRSSKRAMSGEPKSWRKKLRPSVPPRRDGSCGSSVRGCCPAPKRIESRSSGSGCLSRAVQLSTRQWIPGPAGRYLNWDEAAEGGRGCRSRRHYFQYRNNRARISDWWSRSIQLALKLQF
jgi:hypothetical protein